MATLPGVSAITLTVVLNRFVYHNGICNDTIHFLSRIKYGQGTWRVVFPIQRYRNQRYLIRDSIIGVCIYIVISTDTIVFDYLIPLLDCIYTVLIWLLILAVNVFLIWNISVLILFTLSCSVNNQLSVIYFYSTYLE